MSDDILWCLSNAGAKNENGKFAVSKEAEAMIRKMTPKPQVDTSMSNPVKDESNAKDVKKKTGNSKIPEIIVENLCKVGVGTTNLIKELSGVKKAFDEKRIKKLLKKDKVKKALKEVGLDLLDDKIKDEILDQGFEKALKNLIEQSTLDKGDKELMQKLLNIIIETNGADLISIWKKGGTVCDYVSEDDFNRDIAPLLENSEGVRKFVDALKAIVKG